MPVDAEIPVPLEWLRAEWCGEPADVPRRTAHWPAVGRRISGGFYEYDFGDSWLHRLDVVARRPRNELTRRRPPRPAGRSGVPSTQDVLADPAARVDVPEWVAEVSGPDEPTIVDLDALNLAATRRSNAVRAF